MITEELKKKIATAMKAKKLDWPGTEKSLATYLGINPAQLSRVLSGNTFQVLSPQLWLSIARKLEVSKKDETEWKVADTETYRKIITQLKACQENSVSAIFCDDADIGKTFAGKDYAKRNQYAVYIDCSQVKSKPDLVRQIAKEFGVGYEGRYKDVYADLTLYLTTIAQNPLVILDEAGDLDIPARLELKALWNATEKCCGWYQMGADGLREVIRKGIERKAVGYIETYSRYGSRYQHSTPKDAIEKKNFIQKQAAMIIKANAPANVDHQKILIKTEGSLRRIEIELNKIKKAS